MQGGRQFRGYSGEMTLDDISVVITRGGGAVARGNAALQNVRPWQVGQSDIRGVIHKAPTLLLNGWLQVRTVAEPSAPKPTTGTAAKLPDTVLFTWRQRKDYQAALAALQAIVGPENLTGPS